MVVILPWLGVLIYLIVEHDGMRDRSIKQAQAQRREFDEFEALKAKALAKERGDIHALRRARNRSTSTLGAGIADTVRGDPSGSRGRCQRGPRGRADRREFVPTTRRYARTPLAERVPGAER